MPGQNVTMSIMLANAKNLNEIFLRINLQKCHFAKTEIELLAYKFTQEVIRHSKAKLQLI